MHDQRLTISQRHEYPDWLILDFCGSMTFPFGQDLENTTRELTTTKYKNIALNLTDVLHMDGVGLKLLLILCITLRKSNHTLAVFGLNDEIRDIFQLTRMDAILHIYQNEIQIRERGAA